MHRHPRKSFQMDSKSLSLPNSVLSSVVPDLGPETYPGNTKDQDPQYEEASCRQCNTNSHQRIVRHINWWSGDTTQAEWSQRVLTCNHCYVYNIIQTEKQYKNVLNENQSFPLIQRKLNDNEWENRWVAKHPLYEEPFTKKGTGIKNESIHCDKCQKTRHHVVYGEFISSRLNSLFEKENTEIISVVQCMSCHEGTVQTKTH